MTARVQEVRASESLRLVADPEVVEHDRAVIKERVELLNKELSELGIAKYKLDILLKSGYSTLKPSAGIISFWENGRKLHGGGDAKVYMCPGKHLGMSECEGLIPDSGQGYGLGMCPKCRTPWKTEQLIGEIGYRMSSQGWAQVILKWFIWLEMNADVRIIYPPDDIRSASSKEQARQMQGDALRVVRGKRAVRSYPLRNIIKDTSAGAELYNRFYAFIKA